MVDGLFSFRPDIIRVDFTTEIEDPELNYIPEKPVLSLQTSIPPSILHKDAAPVPSTSQQSLATTKSESSVQSKFLKRKKDEMIPTRKAGPLDKWCFPTTAEGAKRDREKLDRMHAEIMEEHREEDEAEKAHAKRRKVERANKRKRRERL